MPTRYSLIMILLLGISKPVLVDAKHLPEGVPGFGMALRPYPTVDASGAVRVLVETWSGRHAARAAGELRLELSDGLTVEAGDLQRTVHPSSEWIGQQDKEWIVRLRPSGGGVHYVTGSLRIPAMDGGWDETECRLSVSVEGDSVVAAGGEGERFERVEASGRFRYGGAYLVRIDGPEHVTYSDIVRKARAQGPLMVTCETCESMDSVQVVATIRANGRATWIRPLPGERVINRKAYEAAVVAITDQQFEPAQGRQGPVSDYLVLRIRIVPETK